MEKHLKKLTAALDKLKAYGATGDAASILEDAYEATAELQGCAIALRARLSDLSEASEEIKAILTD